VSTIKVLVTYEYEVDDETMVEFALDGGDATVVNTEVIYPKVEQVKG